MAGIGTYYTNGGQSAAASATETHIEVTAGSAVVVRIDRVRVSQSTHTTSEQYSLQAQRVTTTGTGTARTPELKMAQAAASSSVEVNSSVEPTYTGTLTFIDIQWNSLVGRDMPYTDGTEHYTAPSALFGIKTVNPSGTTTYTPSVELDFAEIG